MEKQPSMWNLRPDSSVYAAGLRRTIADIEGEVAAGRLDRERGQSAVRRLRAILAKIEVDAVAPKRG